MSEDLRKLTCDEFQNQIAELVGSGANIENHPHVKVLCVNFCMTSKPSPKTRGIFASVPTSPDDGLETT